MTLLLNSMRTYKPQLFCHSGAAPNHDMLKFQELHNSYPTASELSYSAIEPFKNRKIPAGWQGLSV